MSSLKLLLLSDLEQPTFFLTIKLKINIIFLYIEYVKIFITFGHRAYDNLIRLSSLFVVTSYYINTSGIYGERHVLVL